MVETFSGLKNILIVEDDKDMREIYEIFFSDQKDKYLFDFESNAEEALKKLKVKKYDLVLLDIIMEPMSGDAFFMHVRKEMGEDLGEEMGDLEEAFEEEMTSKPNPDQEE